LYADIEGFDDDDDEDDEDDVDIEKDESEGAGGGSAHEKMKVPDADVSTKRSMDDDMSRSAGDKDAAMEQDVEDEDSAVPTWQLTCHRDSVMAVSWSPDGVHVVTGGCDDTAHISNWRNRVHLVASCVFV
jgi:WD40 repeat protein